MNIPNNDNAGKDTIDIRQYIALIWQWAWLIILISAIVGGLTFWVSSQMTPVYQASTILLVNEAPSTKSADYSSILTSERLTRTYAEMMVTQPILAEVITRLSLPIQPGELKNAIEVNPIKDTQLIQVQVRSTDPVQSAQIANTLIEVFSNQVQALQSERFLVSKTSLEEQLTEMESSIESMSNQMAMSSDETTRERLENKITQYRQIYSNLLLSLEQVRLAEAQSISSVVQVEPAIPSSVPVSPRTFNNTFISVLLAAFLVTAMLLIIEALDDTIKTPDDANNHLGVPVLGLIAHHGAEEGKPITESQPRSPVSEAFRTLRTNVQYTSVDRQLQTILVTSPDPGEGKTTVAVNLAIVLAQNGLNVTLIDADLRRPTIHRKFGLNNKIGLSSLFFQSVLSFEGAIQRTRITNLSVITSGELPPNPSELLGSQKMFNILEQIKNSSDVVIIDTPPTMAVTDASVLVPFIDGVLVVLKPGHTKYAAASATLNQLQRVGARVLGLVFNNVELSHGRYRYRYYKGYHGYGSYYTKKYRKDDNPKAAEAQ